MHGALWRARPPHSGWIMGKLNAERFAKLSEDCGQEQTDLKQSVAAFGLLYMPPKQAVNVQRFLKIVKKYTEPTKLTPAILREFAEKMVVHAPENPADTGYSGLLCITR